MSPALDPSPAAAAGMPRVARAWFAVAVATGLVLLLGGCAAPHATSVADELPFDQAVREATDGLVGQTQKLPAFLAKVESRLARRPLVLDPMLDATTGEQTGVTAAMERGVAAHLEANHPQLELLPFASTHLARAQYLLTGTATRESRAGGRAAYRLRLALTDLKSGTVVAQSSALARADGVDDTPLPYYRDSPVLVKDQVLEGYIRTTASAPGQRADAFYLERIGTATLITEATTLYNAARYQDALGQYREARATPAGEQLRVLNGLYLSNAKLGRMAEAEQAFGQVVALGIAHRQLGVKFLFNPGSTEFWSDPRVSGQYAMWLRQIAKEATAARACMDVVGHTSRTGSEQSNDVLSLQRASFIRQRLAADAPHLANRMRAVGMGFRENIVGSGTDNAADALDRRVEFKIVPCG